MTSQISNFLILPDEILLEIYKYLLNAQVLCSFYHVNSRLKASVIGYCHHISLRDVSCAQSHYFCRSVLPEIGHRVRSLLISNCRSVLQGKVFSQYFSHQMFNIFPNLEKLTLISFAADELDVFLGTLDKLDNLRQIEICDLLTEQPNLLQRIVTTNNNCFSSINFKTSYSDLPTSPCINITDLTITIQTLDKLADLLSLIPNVRQLNVTIDEISMKIVNYDHLSPMMSLDRFSLRCYNHFWLLKEIESLLSKMLVLKHLSLQISSQDTSLVDSEQRFIKLLSEAVRHLDFSLRYYYDSIEEIDRQALLTCRFPMICLIDEKLEQAILHTIPYEFPSLNISPSVAAQMSTADKYAKVEILYDDHGTTLSQMFPIIARCNRVNEIAVQPYEETEEPLPSVQQSPPMLPHLFHLKRIWLSHSSREYHSLKSLLLVAPNVTDLFIAFDNLRPIFDDKDTCELLSKRIIHLLILRATPSAPTQLTEEHLPSLATAFTHLRHLQIDVTNGPLIESITPFIIKAFSEHKQLLSLVVEGQSSSDELKSNARQWLIDNAHLAVNNKFDAAFKEQTNRLLLWM